MGRGAAGYTSVVTPEWLTEIIEMRVVAVPSGNHPDPRAVARGPVWPGGGAAAPPPRLVVLVQRGCDGTVRLACTGEVDLATAGGLAGALLTAVTAAPPPAVVVVDLGGVGFLDAAGIGALLTGRTHAADRGVGWRVLGAHGTVRTVLDMAGVVGWLRVRAPERPGGLRGALLRNGTAHLPARSTRPGDPARRRAGPPGNERGTRPRRP